MKETSRENFYAVFAPATEGGYNVSFPDFPGCVTFGSTLEEAQKMAQEVLELWLEELAANNELETPPIGRHPVVAELTVRFPVKLVKHAVTHR